MDGVGRQIHHKIKDHTASMTFNSYQRFTRMVIEDSQ